MLPWLLAAVLGGGGPSAEVIEVPTLTATMAQLQEQEPTMQRTEANRLYDAGVPEHGKMTVQTEHLQAVFEASSAWTLDEIWYDGFQVAGPTGHYGTVLIPQGGEWIGTGHTEGGREVVHELKMTVDGESRPLEVGASIEGERFELVKRSTIHTLDATHTITVLGDEIVERAQLRATEPQSLKLLYLFMHCIEPTTTRWVAELPSGEITEDTFESDGDMELSRNARWVAEWFPEQRLSVLLYLRRLPTEETSAILLWDHERYHKFYVQHNRGLELAAGDELDFTLVLTVVPNETGDWSATRARAEELKAKYPPVDQPDGAEE